LSGKPPASLSSLLTNIAIDAELDGSELKKLLLEADTKSGNLKFSANGSLAPFSLTGYLQTKDFLLNRSIPIDGKIVFSATPALIDFFSEQIKLADVEVAAVNLSLYPHQKDIDFQFSALRFYGNDEYETGRLGRLSADGSFTMESPYLDMSLSLESIRASDVLPTILAFSGNPDIPDSVSEVVENLVISTEVFLSTDFRNISWSAPRFVAALSGPRDAFMVTSLFGNDARLVCDDINVIWREVLQTEESHLTLPILRQFLLRFHLHTAGLPLMQEGFFSSIGIYSL
jgi:hypothetical protein